MYESTELAVLHHPPSPPRPPDLSLQYHHTLLYTITIHTASPDLQEEELKKHEYTTPLCGPASCVQRPHRYQPVGPQHTRALRCSDVSGIAVMFWVDEDITLLLLLHCCRVSRGGEVNKCLCFPNTRVFFYVVIMRGIIIAAV